MMSEPFKLKVNNICPYYFNAKLIKDKTRYIYYNGQSFETLFQGSDFWKFTEFCNPTLFEFE